MGKPVLPLGFIAPIQTPGWRGSRRWWDIRRWFGDRGRRGMHFILLADLIRQIGRLIKFARYVGQSFLGQALHFWL